MQNVLCIVSLVSTRESKQLVAELEDKRLQMNFISTRPLSHRWDGQYAAVPYGTNAYWDSHHFVAAVCEALQIIFGNKFNLRQNLMTALWIIQDYFIDDWFNLSFQSTFRLSRLQCSLYLLLVKHYGGCNMEYFTFQIVLECVFLKCVFLVSGLE